MQHRPIPANRSVNLPKPPSRSRSAAWWDGCDAAGRRSPGFPRWAGAGRREAGVRGRDRQAARESAGLGETKDALIASALACQSIEDLDRVRREECRHDRGAKSGQHRCQERGLWSVPNDLRFQRAAVVGAALIHGAHSILRLFGRLSISAFWNCSMCVRSCRPPRSPGS